MNNALFHGDLVETSRILYTPSSFAKISLTHIQEIGELQAHKPHTSQRNNLQSYLFFIVLSGSGILEYKGDSYTLCAGDCVFIDCHPGYSHQTSEDLWKLQWVHFFGPNMANIYGKYLERGGRPCFHPRKPDDFKQLWQKLYCIVSAEDYIRDMRINEGLNTLLTLLMEESWHPDTQHAGTKMQNLLQVKAYLDTHFCEKILLDDLADQFFIDKFYLSKIFKKQFGVTLHSYLLQMRITRAKQLLRFTDKTVETIATECGMNSVHYFSRMFKKVTGSAPSEYRRLW